MDSVNQLLYLQGIGYDYRNYQGQQVFFNDHERLAALSACGYDINDDDAILDGALELDVKPWLQLIAAQLWVKDSQPCFTIKIDNDFNTLTLEWSLYLNEDLISDGHVPIHTLVEVGNYFYQDKHYSERNVPLCDNALAIGYYRLSAKLVDVNGIDITASAYCEKQLTGSGELIVYPETVYQPSQQSTWGLSAQLYTLVNENNLGVGDFNDLNELIQLSADQGADYVLLNPLHALFEDDIERASPYSPSDRLSLNPIYIHIQNSPDYINNTAANHLLEKTLAQQKLMNRYDGKTPQQYIDYQAVFTHKYPIYWLLFNFFIDENLEQNSARYQAFIAFKQQNQQRIIGYSQWLITRAKLPEQYHHVDFISYLQWQAQTQLAQCQLLAKRCGMSIGIINDLAVGCHQDGYEFVSNQDLFAQGASIGAPPDPWAPAGQNWGLPAMNPVQIKQNGLQHFRQLIRANMQHCGGLRIDHVMGLLRLWWCVEQQNQTELSCYVYYPFEQMLAILALESQINQCTVIGEDLGVVPQEIKSALADAQIYTNSLFYFTKTQSQQFVALEHLPKHTLMMIANHDVATFKAWWLQSDLQLRNSLALFSNEQQFNDAQQQRMQDKENILSWLRDYQPNGTELQLTSDVDILYRTLAITLARSPSRLLTLQLDDLAGEELPVNIPGTDQEYPNWRRRLSKKLVTIFSDNDFFQALNSQRKI
ncbi:4-alpha-glucanotransferase [Colwellia sp. D2M02]|uniref:4-alpha-glucanotransferase n=1 Tax=Colwellia sp. D2M02 TaxID=2841562 RepID=UPI001C0A5BA1|nr:4-alpha-glucanotransferase [Colwellia sp. D2M02]MBU2893400.1 4-alpha-glucanotransferase [Colwellia sp. D2M02]